MQLRKILAAVKPTSMDAHPVRTAIDLAQLGRAHLTVLGVTESPWQLVEPGPAGACMPSRGELVTLAAGRLAERIRPLLGPRLAKRAVVHAAIGLPAIEIVRWSESDGTDLIVLGREGRTRVARVDGADAIEGTVRRARVPCLLVAPGQCSFRRILAAVDGGPNSADVTEAALFVGRLFGASVRALQVQERATVGASATAWTLGRPESSEVCAVAECDTIAREGEPVAEILQALREESADLLVLGHHRGGSVGLYATSGVAPRLLQRAPCAILTVPI